MARSNAAMRGIINSLLAKTLENGCEPGEEEEAVHKAVDLMGLHGFQSKDFEFPPRFDAAGKRRPNQPKPKAPANRGSAGEPAKRPRIIKVACETLLAEVTGHDSDGYSLGHSYADILRKVKEEFPHGRTSIKCLRWYATHMKDQGCVMPQKRERSPAQPRA